MAIVGWVLDVAISIHGIDLKRRQVPITVNMDGLGKGVGDRLNELGVKVRPFHGAATAQRSHQYRNRRAEVYGELAQRLDPKGRWPDTPWRLPDDPLLLDELVAPEKVYGSDGLKFGITPKNRAGNEAHRGAIRSGRSWAGRPTAPMPWCTCTTASVRCSGWLPAGFPRIA